MIKKTTLFLLAFIPIIAFAQKPVTKGEVVEITAEIVAIDKDARLITLEDEDGFIEALDLGELGFGRLNVGENLPVVRVVRVGKDHVMHNRLGRAGRVLLYRAWTAGLALGISARLSGKRRQQNERLFRAGEVEDLMSRKAA